MTNVDSRVAIIMNKGSVTHSTSWSSPWIEYCNNNAIFYELVEYSEPDLLKKLGQFDILLWHFSGYIFSEMLVARSIIYSAKKNGLKVFPDFNEAWHFDDKVSETYLLEAVGAPIVKSYIFYSLPDVKSWIINKPPGPVVAKLRNGSGSHNIKLLKSNREIIKYSKNMFKSGYNVSPNMLYKASSNIRSAKSMEVFFSRLKRVPEFLRTLRYSKMFPKERGYTLFQEYVENTGYDLKVVVVGDKLSGFARAVRKNDFRASGGGDVIFDKALITRNVIDSAFKASDDLGFKCMGYDYVVDKTSGLGKIVEMSYGFSHEVLLQASGYYDRSGTWHDEALNAPKELLDNLIHE